MKLSSQCKQIRIIYIHASQNFFGKQQQKISGNRGR